MRSRHRREGAQTLHISTVSGPRAGRYSGRAFPVVSYCCFMSLVPQPLLLGPIPEAEISEPLPPLLQPLMRAAQHGEDVAPIALAIANTFGFDGFWYGVSLSLQPSQESMIYVYSTWPAALTQLYDQQAFGEIDPRIQPALISVVPPVSDPAS